MVERFKDFYGCTASIKPFNNGFRLIARDYKGRKIRDHVFATHRGAVRAMNHDCESTAERIN